MDTRITSAAGNYMDGECQSTEEYRLNTFRPNTVRCPAFFGPRRPVRYRYLDRP